MHRVLQIFFHPQLPIGTKVNLYVRMIGLAASPSRRSPQLKRRLIGARSSPQTPDLNPAIKKGTQPGRPFPHLPRQST